MFIPAGKIDGGGTQYVAASFAIGSFSLRQNPASLVMEWRMNMRGNVRVLRFLNHRVDAVATCLVGVSSGDGSVLGFRC